MKMKSIKQLLQIILFVIVTVNTLNARSEAGKLCHEEINKEHPQVNIVNKECLIGAKEYEEEQEYDDASWYYVLSNKHGYNINKIKKEIHEEDYNYIAYSYVLLNDFGKVESLYKSFLQNSSIAISDRNIQKNYKLLFKLYPTKKENLEKGLIIWNRLYKPIKELDTLNEQEDRATTEQEKLVYLFKAIEITEEHLGEEHKESYRYYAIISNIYKDMKDDRKRVVYLKKRLKYSEKQMKMLEKHFSGKKLGREALSIKKNFAYQYEKIGRLYNKIKNYSEAVKYFEKAILKYEKIFKGKERIKEVELSLKYGTLSSFYQDNEQYVKALEYKLKKCEIIDCGDYTHDEISKLYIVIGNYEQALKFTKKVIESKEKIAVKYFGIENSGIFKQYDTLAFLYSEMGNYKKAIEYYEKALTIKQMDTKGKKRKFLMDLGKTMFSFSDGKVKNMVEVTKDYNIAYSHTKLGELSILQENYPKALVYLEKSLQINQKLLDNGETNTINNSYLSLGMLYQLQKKYDKSSEYYNKSLVINKKIFGDTHTSLASNYFHIASLYKDMEDYDKSLKYHQKALSINEKILGKKHRVTAMDYNAIGLNYYNKGDYEKAYKYFIKSFNIFLQNKDKDFSILSSIEKEKYLKTNNYNINNILNVSALYIDKLGTGLETEKIVKEIITNWLNYKGSIFDSENAIATLYENTKDQALKEKIEALTSSKRRLAQLYQSSPSKSKEQKIWKEKIKRTEQTITELSNQIATKAESFNEQQGLKSISYQDIAKNLKEDELYIDYAKAGEYYYIFTLDKQENISFTQIDEKSTKEIDMLVKIFRANITKATDSSKENLSKLYELTILKPLSTIVQSKKRLIISPDGALRLVPFEAMFDKTNNQYLIETKEIRYIPSGKELLRLYKYNHKRESKSKVVVFANPNFKATNIKESKIEEEISITPNTHRGAMLEEFYDKFRKINPLPGTKEEADNIKKILQNSLTVIDYQEEKANEANLMQVKQPKILHIATHGFFINDNSFPNPMLKSGIILSGATTSTIKGKSDGIVTALKLSGLKLKGTDLVVLSACETGVVDINSTDSVSGLGKAFIQAGAKDIVMSLWSVNDQATQELMTSFYEEMQTHPNYSKALKEAKLKMIKNSIHPFYWAGFVLSGL